MIARRDGGPDRRKLVRTLQKPPQSGDGPERWARKAGDDTRPDELSAPRDEARSCTEI